MKNDKAFTLAEVLITLGIIGIVAALTIPPLIHNYKKKQASVKLKRFYSIMMQAVELSEIDNGSSLKWQKANMVYNDDGTFDYDANRQDVINFYNTYLKNYIKDVKTVESTDQRIYVYLIDGSMFNVYNGSCYDISYYLDGNTKNGVWGKNIFKFLICSSSNNNSYHQLTPNKAFGSYGGQGGLTTREKALKKCEEDGYYCTVLLEIYDNWEFKDDYPYKL